MLHGDAGRRLVPGLDPQAAQGATGRASKKNFSGQKLGKKKKIPDGKAKNWKKILFLKVSNRGEKKKKKKD